MNIFKRRESFAVYLVLLILALDQWTKAIISSYPRGLVTRCFSLLNIVHVKNSGAAFSFLAGSGDFLRISFLILLPILIIGFVIYYAYKERSNAFRFYALVSIIAGAIGNLIDRIRFGSVIDFIDFHYKHYHYASFNLADIAVSVGVVLLALKILKKDKKTGKKA